MYQANDRPAGAREALNAAANAAADAGPGLDAPRVPSLMSLCVANAGLDPARFDFSEPEYRAQLEGIAALIGRPRVAAFLVALRASGLEEAAGAVADTPDAAEVALVYAAINVARACQSQGAERAGEAELFTDQCTAERFAAALDALWTWQTVLNTDISSATCVAFELQFVYASIINVFKSVTAADMCGGIRRVVGMVERQDAAFGQHIRAIRGLYRLARSTRDVAIAVQLPGSWKDWVARKHCLQDVYESFQSDDERLPACLPLAVTGRVASHGSEEYASDLYRDNMRSL